MQEQNFEQNVRHKLDELILAPSQPVWEGVALELKKKKERRRLLFFLLLLPILAGMGIYLGGGMDDQLSSRPQPPPQENGDRTVVPEVADGTREGNVAKGGERPEDGSITVDNNRERQVPSSTPSARPNETGTSEVQPLPRVQRQGNTRLPVSIEQVTVAAKKLSDAKSTSLSNDAQLPSVKDEEVAASGQRVKVDSIAFHSQPPRPVRRLSPFEPTFKNIAPLAAPTAQKKWSWSLYAGAGISGSRSSLFTDVQPARADYQSGSGGLSPTAAPNATPSQVNNGRSYSAGIELQRSIGKKAWFVTGVHYRLAQTRIVVGATRPGDTSVRNNNNAALSVSEIYFAGSAQKLTNRYHFVEVPVGIQWQPFRRIPLMAQLNATGARMVAADAVVFGTQSRVYYKEKKAYHNNQLYLGAGFDYRVLGTKGFMLRAGPYVQYGVTTLERRGWSDQHLFATGIKTNISF